MSLANWVGSYAIEVLFCLWLIRWGGAERLEGTFASGFLVSWFAPNWTSDGIKVFGWAALVAGTGWFVIGVFWPDFRL